jgi:hypothetical protein
MGHFLQLHAPDCAVLNMPGEMPEPKAHKAGNRDVSCVVQNLSFQCTFVTPSWLAEVGPGATLPEWSRQTSTMENEK